MNFELNLLFNNFYVLYRSVRSIEIVNFFKYDFYIFTTKNLQKKIYKC